MAAGKYFSQWITAAYRASVSVGLELRNLFIDDNKRTEVIALFLFSIFFFSPIPLFLMTGRWYYWGNKSKLSKSECVCT